MEARLQVTPIRSVIGTAPPADGDAAEGFEAALASATASSSQAQAKGASQAPATPEGGEAPQPLPSSEGEEGGGAQEATSDQLKPEEADGGLSPEFEPIDAEDALPQALLAKQEGEAEVAQGALQQVATGERQQSAPGKAGDGVTDGRSAPQQQPVMAAQESRKPNEEAATGSRGPEGRPPVVPHPSGDSGHPNSAAPGLKVASEATGRRGPPEAGPSQHKGASAAPGLNSSSLNETSSTDGGAAKTEGGQGQGAAGSPFARLEGDGADAPSDQAGVTEAGSTVTNRARGAAVEPLASSETATGDAAKVANGQGAETARPQAKEPIHGGPKAESGTELLAQLQGSRQVQNKLEEGKAKPQVPASAAAGVEPETAAEARGSVTARTGGGEKLDPELAREVAALQSRAVKAEPGLRSGMPAAEPGLQPQPQEGGGQPTVTEHGEGLELDSASRLHQVRTADARAHAQADTQAALRQPVAAERMAPELRERMMMMINSRTNQAEIRLDPPELGALQVKIQMNGDQAQVQLHAQQPQTREMVEQALPRLREMLAQQGITLADTQVSQGDHGQADTQGGEPGGDGGVAGDAMVEASDEALVTVQQMTGRNAEGGIDYYA
ncbi:hypothetical protein FCL40_16170 [Ferrimonas sediminicola]|uniref:Flagellar hook-length control protein-like C-terminal domain-containing protein n=1 Tax=Ferrimonas sediminicola TaxID=2569538 RepID=A0A4U1B9L8_9GAMM|nr:flagellar hook-length control protein FliK [Ferrimonas sediminicola]TKB47237.1 hypothetical protein FCL40_16170 [Ferrimonas sediminicola]